MTTRSMACARQEENKLELVSKQLDQALKQLQAVRKLNEHLDRERDDNEAELLKAFENNNKIKKEMAELHTENTLLVDERDRLLSIIDRFKECSEEYTQGLNRMSVLEHELQEAHHTISHLQSEKLDISTSQTQCLFDELVGSAPSHLSASGNSDPFTIDLTCDDTLKSNNKGRLGTCSRNKLKKYVRINRYIKKTQKLVKKQKCIFNNVKCIKQRRQLGDELDMYALLIENNMINHENNIKKFQSEILKLEESLINMTLKYNSTKNEYGELMLAMQDLLNPSNEDSLMPSGTPSKDQSSTTHSTYNSHKFTNCNLNSSAPKSMTNIPPVNGNIVMYSDELGKDMGHLLTTNGQSLINHCIPGATLSDIMNKIIKTNFHNETTLIIMVGNRGSVNKNILSNYLDSLTRLNVKQIVIFTLPYSNSLPQVENNHRYNINMTLHTLTYNVNKIHVIDINNYIKKYFYLTKDKYYLNKHYKRLIAISLSYYLDCSAKNLATIPAPIEQKKPDMCNQTLELVPSNLNVILRQ